MDFSYYDNDKKLTKLNLKVGAKLDSLSINNSQLNSIFSKIDDGDGRITNREELTKLEKLLHIADGIINQKHKDKILENDELSEVIKQIDEGKINLAGSSDSSISRENVIQEATFSKEDYRAIKNNEADSESILQKYIDKIKESLQKYHNYDERFPENRYEVEVIYDGKFFRSFVYDKEFANLKKANPQKLQKSIDEFIGGNFDVIYDIENPVEFLEAYRKKSGGKTMFSELMASYENGQLSSNDMKNYFRSLESKFEKYEREYKAANSDDKFDNVYSFFYGDYFKLSNRIINHVEHEEYLQYQYENNDINREQVLDLQNFIKENYNIEINEYIAAKIIDINDYDYGIFEGDFEELKNYYKNCRKRSIDNVYVLDENTESNIDKNQIKEIQNIVKERFNEEISDAKAVSMIKTYLRRNGETKGFDLDRFKADCLSGKIFKEYHVKDFENYLETRVEYEGLIENDSLATLEEAAQTTEIEYGRYNFDIHKSEVADLAYQSEKMIRQAEKELQVTKNDNKIVIKNRSTGKKREIDLNQLTSKLDNEHRQMILNALSGFNKLSLWEFAMETTNGIGTDVHDPKRSLAEYNIDKDIININVNVQKDVSTNDLLHEMVHAMMATVIDGKNTSNEPLFKEFADTYAEEQKVHKEKRLRNGSADGSNYTYCAQNIMEFAAEAGCLWLSGKSHSEFTIAKHFPKSYRLFIQLIEKIRAKKNGRTTST